MEENEEVGEFYLGVERQTHGGVVVTTPDEVFELSEAEKNELLEEIGADSIWSVFGKKVKAVRFLRDGNGT